MPTNGPSGDPLWAIAALNRPADIGLEIAFQFHPLFCRFICVIFRIFILLLNLGQVSYSIFFSYFQILLLFLFHLKTWFITLMPPALSPNMVTLSKDLIPRLLPVDCNDKSRPSLGLPQIWRCSPGPTASPAPGEERLSLYIFTLYQGKPPHQISLIITKRSFTGEHPGRLVVNQIRSMVSFSHQDVT